MSRTQEFRDERAEVLGVTRSTIYDLLRMRILKWSRSGAEGTFRCRHAVSWFGGGQGRGRTADLPIFSRMLVPTELPGRDVRDFGDQLTRTLSDPDRTRTDDLRRDRAAL